MLNVRLLNILWQHIEKDDKWMESAENPFSVSWARNWFTLILNSVLENILVWAQFSLKLSNGTYVYALSRSNIEF